MFHFVIFACVFISGLCAPTDYDDLDLPNLGIVGGSAVTIEQHPYQVSLELFGEHFCGGSIINKYTVITAAHCTQTDFTKHIDIRAGTTYRNEGGEIIRVKKVIDHPQYNRKNYDYDISILILKSPLQYKSSIQPIDIPSSPVIKIPSAATVSGWGRTQEKGTLSSYLQKVNVPLMSDIDCKTAYPGKITRSMMCAGISEGGKDACQADSGGPMAMNGKLVGVVSWGIGCGRAGNPGVYTNVGFFHDWIKNVIKLEN